MRFEIDRMQAFYASPLGEMVRERLAGRISALWPNADGLDMLGIGYADPLLEPYRAGARRVLSAAPGDQGAAEWPVGAPGCSVEVEEERLPFQDAMFDRIMVLHGLEDAESPQRLLREIWRVAAPEARIVFIVANRRGLWARAESTPMGHGRPYTRTQMNQLLEGALFEPTASSWAVFAPPINWGPVTSAGESLERIGRFAWPGFGGVLLIEAVKRVYAEPRGGVKARASSGLAQKTKRADARVDSRVDKKRGQDV